MLDIVAPSCYSCRALVIHLFFVPFESTCGRYFRMWRYAFMRLLKMFCLVLFLATATLILFHSRVASAQDSPSRIGERPALEGHVIKLILNQAKSNSTTCSKSAKRFSPPAGLRSMVKAGLRRPGPARRRSGIR